MPEKDLLKITALKTSKTKSRSITQKVSVKKPKGKSLQSSVKKPVLKVKPKSKPKVKRQPELYRGLRYAVELDLHVHQSLQRTKPPKKAIKTAELVLETSGNVVTAGTVRIHTEGNFGIHTDVVKAVGAEDMWLILRLLEIIK